MRKITAGMFITLDGIIEAPEKWNPPYYSDEMTQIVMAQIAASDLHLYGRRSYELFRTVFTGPGAAGIPHAEMMTSAPKVVVSTTLDDPGWGPTTVISSDVAAELTKLKHQPGKNINVGASGTLVTFLLQEDLLDELLLFVHPVLIGTGKHLFEAGNDRVALQLLESKAHDNGVVALRYGRPVTAP
jgi:dihydrofolate reductase